MNALPVLIIDDEKDICFLLGNVLSEKKYAVTIAHSLNDGLEKLSRVKPVILFLDIRLPDGSGLEAVSEIRKQNPRIKIIIMSAYDGVNEKKQAIELGADAFIGKPLTIEMISQTLQSIRHTPTNL